MRKTAPGSWRWFGTVFLDMRLVGSVSRTDLSLVQIPTCCCTAVFRQARGDDAIVLLLHRAHIQLPDLTYSNPEGGNLATDRQQIFLALGLRLFS